MPDAPPIADDVATGEPVTQADVDDAMAEAITDAERDMARAPDVSACPDCRALPGETHMPDCEIARRDALLPDNLASHSLMLPSAAMWAHIQRVAEDLSRSGLVGKAFVGKPNNIMLVGLYCHDLGISLSMGLAKMHVINGKVGMAAELMTALIEREGYDVDGEVYRDEETQRPVRAEVVVTEPGGKVRRADFTITDAVAADLCEFDETRPNGVRARSDEGNALPWESYTADMLWARAVSRVARRYYSSVLSGVTYTPDELPGYVWSTRDGGGGSSSGGGPAFAPSEPLTDDQREWLNAALDRARAGGRWDALRRALETAVNAQIIPPRDQIGADHFDTVKGIIDRIVGADTPDPAPPAATEDIPEAEVIPPATSVATVGDPTVAPSPAAPDNVAVVMRRYHLDEADAITWVCNHTAAEMATLVQVDAELTADVAAAKAAADDPTRPFDAEPPGGVDVDKVVPSDDATDPPGS